MAGDIPSDADADVVFQCAFCRSVVGDTQSEYQAHLEHETLSLKAASNVSVGKELHVSKKGFDSGCTYQRFICCECGAHLVRICTSTTVELDSLRSTYNFKHTALVRYQLGCGKTMNSHYAPNADRQGRNQTPKLGVTSHGVSEEVFDELDAHVQNLTDATNKVTEAFNQNKQSTDEAFSEQRESMENVQQISLLWEERFQRLEACQKSIAKLADDFHVGDDRLSQLEETVRSSNLTRIAESENQRQFLRESPSSPAKSSLKRTRQ